MDIRGIIFDIKRYAIHDGPGIRTTVFLKGCPMSCWWCHNPESHKKEPENIYRTIHSTKNNFRDRKDEIIGREVSVSEVMFEIEKDRIFYDESGGGVTFSGGEPLYQPEFLLHLLLECKKSDIHTTIDTAGYVATELLIAIAEKTDLFLFDLKLYNEEKHKFYMNVSNKQIFENLAQLVKLNKKVIIRIPVIPTINDSEKDINEIGNFIATIGITDVELLPYHKLGEEKYLKLNKMNRMRNIDEHSMERLEEIKKQYQKFGLIIKIEG